MPNHVANELVIKGESSELADFIRFARGTGIHWKGSDKPEIINDLELSQFIHPELSKRGQELSMPYSALGTGEPMGYDWCLNNWGTKWGAYDCILHGEEFHGQGEISYQFNTAWSTFNAEISTAMSNVFPTLRFELNFFEPGMAFKGTRIWSHQTGIELDTCTDLESEDDHDFNHPCMVSAG